MAKKNKKNNKKKLNELTVIKLVPHALTVGALCMGLFAVRYSIIGSFTWASLCILVACFLDGIDGRVARKLNVASDFGAEMDSLADFFNFGVAPGFVMYFWKMNEYTCIKGIGWLPVLLLAVCMAIRLARFNVSLNNYNPNNPLQKYFFQGIPAPMAALLVLLPLLISLDFENVQFVHSPLFIILNTSIVAILAGSTIPTPCFKKITFKNNHKNLLVLIMAVVLVCLCFKPWTTLIVFAIVYVISIVASWFFYISFKNEMSSKK